MNGLAWEALQLFVSAATRAYRGRVDKFVVFGSRARGDPTDGSDLDVAVVLLDPHVDHYREKMGLADLAYDAIVETGVHLQPWPISLAEWRDPETHTNPSLVRAMRRDGLVIEGEYVPRAVFQGA
jgi:antitoxin ChpS